MLETEEQCPLCSSIIKELSEGQDKVAWKIMAEKLKLFKQFKLNSLVLQCESKRGSVTP
jgi:hypothetical protein